MNTFGQYPTIDFRRQYQRLVVKRFIAETLFAFLLQYMGLMMSVLTPTPSPVWVASGTALALIFLRGYQVIVGIGLGTFFTYYMAAHRVGLAAACAMIFVVQSIAIVWLTRKHIIPTLLFFNRRSLFKFVLLSLFVTAISSFLLMMSCTHHLHSELWLQWWFANLNGILMVAIAWITADAFLLQRRQLQGDDLAWYKMVVTLFFIGFLLNLGIYLHMPPLASLNMMSMWMLEIMLFIGTFILLFSVIQ